MPDGSNVIELRGKYGVHHPCPRQAGVMMRFKAVTRSLHSKKKDLFLHLKIKSLNSMTLLTVDRHAFSKCLTGHY